EVLKHRAAIQKWRTTLTEGERFNLNSPDAILRHWKKKSIVPDPNAPPRTSAMSKLKETNIDLQEKLHRAEREIARGGGDLWTKHHTAADIADIRLIKLGRKADRAARAILKKLKEQKKEQPKPAAQDAASSADERKALYAVDTE